MLTFRAPCQRYWRAAPRRVEVLSGRAAEREAPPLLRLRRVVVHRSRRGRIGDGGGPGERRVGRRGEEEEEGEGQEGRGRGGAGSHAHHAITSPLSKPIAGRSFLSIHFFCGRISLDAKKMEQ